MATVRYSKTEVLLAHKKCKHPATCPCQHKPESVKPNA